MTILTALGDSAGGCEIAVLSVHVVCTTAGTVAKPDAKVLDRQRLLLIDLQQIESNVELDTLNVV